MSVSTSSESRATSDGASRLDRTDWLSIAGMGAVVLFLHLFGWGVLVFGVAPQHITLGSTGVFGVGLGLTAYLLGVRHAFDADHIAVIDNTTRKLVAAGRRPVSVGFWVALGHSPVQAEPVREQSGAVSGSLRTRPLRRFTVGLTGLEPATP